VNTETEQLGEFSEDAFFFGLEEIDGKEYNKVLNATKSTPLSVTPVTESDDNDITESIPDNENKKEGKKKKKDNKEKKKDKRNKQKSGDTKPTEKDIVEKSVEVVSNTNSPWNSSVVLHDLLTQALRDMNFQCPTPIQTSSIPLILQDGCDVVGVAETGSGKTLAFGLPILHTLLHEWDVYGNTHSPFALILAPTRELAMQITTVLNDVTRRFSSLRRVEVVNVIGGMSEHKQRRQLSSSGKPIHIIVGTPGRLCDLLNDSSVPSLQDLSLLRYLVIDEADRMVEDGHFPELYKIFSRIREHEKIASSGRNPVEVNRLAKIGMDFDEDDEVAPKVSRTKGEDEDDEEVEEFDMDADPVVFDEMPSEADIEAARESQPPVPIDEIEEEEEEDLSTTQDMDLEESNPALRVSEAYVHCGRQTLLFSATAMGVGEASKESKRGRKQNKLEHSLCDKKRVAYLRSLGIPEHLRQLLEAVGVKDETVVTTSKKDPNTGDESRDAVSSKKDKKRKRTEEQDEKDCGGDNESAGPLVLPAGLSQYEVRLPVEDKDVIAYHFLLKHMGRTLIFVNSIKTARRVDGLLRALQINCRTIHSQLQQKQRIKALEGFNSSPIGALVATDVAARGLDLPRVQYVLHYDIARSPQVYIHRSGRTARAGAKGTSLSLVTPEDDKYHSTICAALKMPSFPIMRMDLSSAPILRERVKLAKKIFLQSFIASQGSKQKSWLEQSAEEAGLEVDASMYEEITSELTGRGKHREQKTSKKGLEKDKAKLKMLLQEPLEDSRSSGFQGRRNKRSFIVVAK